MRLANNMPTEHGHVIMVLCCAFSGLDNFINATDGGKGIAN
jgi:hypothetical protein